MKIQFYLRFYTHPGQNLFLSGNIPELGNSDNHAAFPLTYKDSQFWSAEMEADPAAVAKIQYHYFLRNDDGSVVTEWGDDRIIDISKSGTEEIQVIDTWNHAGEYENVFFTAPFQQTLLRRSKRAGKTKQAKSFTHIFKVKAPLLKKDERLYLRHR